MKKIFFLCAVVLAFALLLGVGIKGAQADSILFPFLSIQPGVYSFVSIANEGLNEFATLTGYHLTYAYKTVPVGNKKSCSHFDGNIISTPGDLLTFEAGGKVITNAGTFVLFEGGPGDVPVTSTGLPIPGATNVIGFLVVEPLGNAIAAEDDTRIEVFGWMDVVDTAANMSLSYSSGGLGVNTSVNPNFNLSLVGTNWFRFMWEPTAYVTTSWYILPLGTRAVMAPPAGGGIRILVRANNGTLAGAWDRDEIFWSGEKLTPVRCLGIITTADILQPAVVAATVNGGFLYAESWGSLTLAINDPDDPGSIYGAGDFLAYRIQAVTAAAGLGTRQAINAEPQLDPAYDITLDVGP